MSDTPFFGIARTRPVPVLDYWYDFPRLRKPRFHLRSCLETQRRGATPPRKRKSDNEGEKDSKITRKVSGVTYRMQHWCIILVLSVTCPPNGFVKLHLPLSLAPKVTLEASIFANVVLFGLLSPKSSPSAFHLKCVMNFLKIIGTGSGVVTLVSRLNSPETSGDLSSQAQNLDRTTSFNPFVEKREAFASASFT